MILLRHVRRESSGVHAFFFVHNLSKYCQPDAKFVIMEVLCSVLFSYNSRFWQSPTGIVDEVQIGKVT